MRVLLAAVSAILFHVPVAAIARPPASASSPRVQIQQTQLSLDRVSCPDVQHCVAVGSSGTALITTDGGSSWQEVSTGTNQLLMGVTCVSDSSCWAVGENGTIVATSNGGATWTSQVAPTSQFLWSVYCMNQSNCWASGDNGTIVFTSNGGVTWSLQTTATTSAVLGLACPSATDCIAGTNTGLLTTSDGGAHWNPANAGVPEGFFGVSCMEGTLQCWAVGSGGTIVFTPDGGTTWTTQQSSQQMNQLDFEYDDAFWSVSCKGGSFCLTVGGGTPAMATSDGGTSWQPVPLPTADLYTGVSCPSVGTCFASGTGARIYETTDAGATWTPVLEPATPPGSPVRVLIVGDSTAWTLGLGLSAMSVWYGDQITNAAILGCGVALGEPITFDGNQGVDVAPPCNGEYSSTNLQLPQYWYIDVVFDRPQVVVLLAGRFEVCDRWVDGRYMNILQPAYQAVLESQMRDAIEVLTSTGAHLVLLTAPYYSEINPANGLPYDQDDPARVDAYNALVKRVAAEFPSSVSVIDLNSKVDPSGRYANEIDSVQVREPDGVHFELSGGEWLAPWLLPQLNALAPASPSPQAGLRAVSTDGNVYTYGDAQFYGSAGGLPLAKPIVGMAATPDGGGYWLVASDGGVFTYGPGGQPPYLGSASGASSSPVVSIVPADGGFGYWLVNASGQTFAYGLASSLGSSPFVTAPVVAAD